MRRFWWLASFLWISCNPMTEALPPLTSEAGLEKGLKEEDVDFKDLPELNQEEVSKTPNYDFLAKEDFWEKLEEITKIPPSKACSNKESYAHFGIARLVYEKIYGDFRLLPFGNGLRYVPFFEAWPGDPTRHELFLTTELMKRVYEITRFTEDTFSIPLTLTSLTKFSGVQHDNHCRHRSGTVIDVRPFPATRPMTWRDDVYDFEMNLEFMRHIVSHPDVNLVFFNDPNLLNHPELNAIIERRKREENPILFRAVGGHDNHYHIEFKLDSEVDFVSRYIKQRLGQL